MLALKKFRLRNIFRALLPAVIAAAVAPTALGAMPDRPYDVWRSVDEAHHYFLHDYTTQTWSETINCSETFRFTLAQQKPDGIILYDASRDLYVYLTAKRMFLIDKPSQRWVFYRNGAFDPRFLYQHVDDHGGPVGYISLRPACTWAEINTGYFFKETQVQYDQIVIYDATRNMYAQLGDQVIALRIGPIGNFNYFRRGSWQ